MAEQTNSTSTIGPDVDPNTAPYTNPDYLGNTNPPPIINEGNDSIAQPREGIDGNNEHDPSKGAALGGLGGAIVGALAGGPVGAVIGAVAGAAVSGAAVAGVDTFDEDRSPGEIPERFEGETPGEYTDRMIAEREAISPTV